MSYRPPPRLTSRSRQGLSAPPLRHRDRNAQSRRALPTSHKAHRVQPPLNQQLKYYQDCKFPHTDHFMVYYGPGFETKALRLEPFKEKILALPHLRPLEEETEWIKISKDLHAMNQQWLLEAPISIAAVKSTQALKEHIDIGKELAAQANRLPKSRLARLYHTARQRNGGRPNDFLPAGTGVDLEGSTTEEDGFAGDRAQECIRENLGDGKNGEEENKDVANSNVVVTDEQHNVSDLVESKNVKQQHQDTPNGEGQQQQNHSELTQDAPAMQVRNVVEPISEVQAFVTLEIEMYDTGNEADVESEEQQAPPTTNRKTRRSNGVAKTQNSRRHSSSSRSFKVAKSENKKAKADKKRRYQDRMTILLGGGMA